MKTQAIFFLMLVIGFNSFAQASKSTTKPKSKTTVSKTTKSKQTTTKTQQSAAIPDDAYYFKDNNNKTATITTAYKTIVVTGDGNHIDIGDGNGVIFVKGKNNDINMKTADYIEVTGDGNFVSWEASKSPTGKPVVLDKGGYNNVGKRASGALNKSDN